MRKLLLPLLLTSAPAFSTDLLVVIGGGGNNTHPTITSALAAAVAGDRLLIQPGQYNENVTITKSVELVSNVSGQRYTVNGDIAFAPATTGCTATVMDALVLDSIKTGAVTGTGHTFRVVACRMPCFSNPSQQITTQLLRDSIMGTAQMYPPCDVIGCFIGGVATPDYFPLIVSTTSLVQNSKRTRIIGNKITTASTSNYLLLGVPSASPFDVQNNYFVIPGPATPSAVIFVSNPGGPGYNTTTPCSIQNNTIRWPGASAIAAIQVLQTAATFLVDIRNNFLLGNLTITATGPGASQGFNFTTTDLAQVVVSTGALQPGSVAVNAGDPEVAYTDLDLSRNDAGCYGGSLSRDNFDDALPTSAVVGMVNAPRRTQAALTIPITADGFDR